MPRDRREVAEQPGIIPALGIGNFERGEVHCSLPQGMSNSSELATV
jgi:hypothetical protein